jgi:predicted dithiol-disulfide oxidoreductase (DUF899 family)
MQHKVVSRDEWVATRKALLVREKELTHLRDKLAAEWRALPWVKVEKEYIFDTPAGKKTLAELFDGRSQLIVKHFMLGPEWEDPCTGCSFEVDHVEGALVHLEHHDVTYVAVSRAPLAKIEAMKKRMGWYFKWVSSAGSDFNYDYHVSFTPKDVASGHAYYNYEKQDVGIDELSGRSVFYKDETGNIFHTYSSYARDGEETLGTYAYLDITPKGRNENGPHHNLMDWVKRHDEYEKTSAPSSRHE